MGFIRKRYIRIPLLFAALIAITYVLTSLPEGLSGIWVWILLGLFGLVLVIAEISLC